MMDLPSATLDEALRRVVIPLKQGNSIADAVRKSHFLNHYDSQNPRGVIPLGDDLIEFARFTSLEFALTVLPEEFQVEGRSFRPALYKDAFGERRRFFSEKLGSELEGKIVYFVITPSTNDFWRPDQIAFRMQIATATAKELGAEKVYAVFSEYPFARQDRGENAYNRADENGSTDKDRKKHGGQTDYVSVLLRGLIANSCDGVVVLHHHSGHFETAAADCLRHMDKSSGKRYVFNIQPTFLLARYLQTTDIIPEEYKANAGEGIVFISPDAGALEFTHAIRGLAGFTNSQIAYINKRRLRANDPSAIQEGILIPVDGSSGDYKGKIGITADDMADTFGTMSNALNLVPSDISRFLVYASHGIFADKAEDRMRRFERITDFIVMDTRPSRLRVLGADAKRKVTILKPAQMLAYALAQCVEKGINPNMHFAELFKRDPSVFDKMYKEKRFDQHYSK